MNERHMIIGVYLTENDYKVSATSLMINQYLKVFEPLRGKVDKMVDLGCAYGGVTACVKNYVGATEAWGIDIDKNRLTEANSKGIKSILANLNDKGYPLPTDYFDLVTSNGVIEHLNWYDEMITESHRILKLGAHLIITWPNLANYIQRLTLLLGYQPTDVNISRNIYAGTLYCRGMEPQGHIRSATGQAMKDLLEYYHFKVISLIKADPVMESSYSWYWRWFFKMVGKIMPTNLSRRLIIVAQKGWL